MVILCYGQHLGNTQKAQEGTQVEQVTWAEPPPKAVIKERDPSVVMALEAVRLNPGKAAIIKRVSKNNVGSTMRRWRSWYPDIEFTSRREATGLYAIYARTV